TCALPILGRITIDDVVDIIREQAEHQALGAAGLDEDEDLFSPIRRAVRGRLVCVVINPLTAFLAAAVIGQFDATIEKIVALAVLMPIVAGIGGNAAVQVLTLMVRGLALGQVGPSNASILLWKELRVALINGLLIGLLVGAVALLWFGSWALSWGGWGGAGGGAGAGGGGGCGAGGGGGGRGPGAGRAGRGPGGGGGGGGGRGGVGFGGFRLRAGPPRGGRGGRFLGRLPWRK